MRAEKASPAPGAPRLPHPSRADARPDLRLSKQLHTPGGRSFHDAGLTTFEQRLAKDPRWALSEGSKFFMGTGSVQEALYKITRNLDELGIPYAVVGGMALFLHGYRRFTEDVDILVSMQNLRVIHERLEGRGYLPPFARSKHLRDTEFGVKIEFLVTGDYPGDGKPKPVSFPDPAQVAIEKDGIKILGLPTLVELKLASGMTSTDRQKDLVDVQELIKTLHLPLDFSQGLADFVRGKYVELWQATQPEKKRYVRLWRNKWITAQAKSIDEMAESLQVAAAMLQAMKLDGVTLDMNGGIEDDYAYLVTADPEIAKKYDMHPEEEFLEDDPEGDDPAPG